MHHIPNILSVFRIVLIPFFICFAIRGDMFEAAIVLIVSAITGFFDGFLARRFNWVTNLGKILDPAADKLTQIAVCALFAVRLYQYWFFFVFLILKEMLIASFTVYLVKKRVVLSGARWFGKITTALFYATMILIALFPALPVQVVYGLLVATTICALAATLLYIPEYVQHKKLIEPKIGLSEEQG